MDKQAVLALVNEVGMAAYGNEAYQSYADDDTDVVECTMQAVWDSMVLPQLVDTGIPEEEWGCTLASDFDEWFGISGIAHVVRDGAKWDCTLAELIACRQFPVYIAAYTDVGAMALGGEDTGATKMVAVVTG